MTFRLVIFLLQIEEQVINMIEFLKKLNKIKIGKLEIQILPPKITIKI